MAPSGYASPTAALSALRERQQPSVPQREIRPPSLASMSSANESKCPPAGVVRCTAGEHAAEVARRIEKRRQIPVDHTQPRGMRGVHESPELARADDVGRLPRVAGLEEERLHAPRGNGRDGCSAPATVRGHTRRARSRAPRRRRGRACERHPPSPRRDRRRPERRGRQTGPGTKCGKARRAQLLPRRQSAARST